MYLSAQSVKINSRLFKGHRSIDTSNELNLYVRDSLEDKYMLFTHFYLI